MSSRWTTPSESAESVSQEDRHMSADAPDSPSADGATARPASQRVRATEVERRRGGMPGPRKP